MKPSIATNTDLRIYVAELLEWTEIQNGFHCTSGKYLLNATTDIYGVIPADKGKHEDDQSFIPLPNYPNDLNACALFERGLSIHLRRTYYEYLIELTQANRSAENWWTCATATARQRCIAFVLTMESQK